MQIIVRDNTSLLMARLEESRTIPESTKKIANSAGFNSRIEANKFLFPDKSVCNFSGIDKLITSINTAKSYELLPDIILFNYSKLEADNASPHELSTAINFSYKMAAERLRKKPKHVTLMGRASQPISYTFKEDLEKNNFAGCIKSAMIKQSVAFEETRDNFNDWNKDRGFWAKGTFQNKITTSTNNPYDLTFRQEQILQLIKTRGLSNGQISNMLKISESTVKMHVGLILKKYGFRTRMQLVTNMY